VYEGARCDTLRGVRAVRVTDAHGCEWEIRAFRVRLPPWRQIDLGGDTGPTAGDYDVVSLVLSLLALPFTLVLVPLAIALVELPLAVARAAFSDTAWVEAVSYWPHETRYLWRTTRADAPGVRAYVAAHLPDGHDLRPARAELVQATRPVTG
jgi:hypothetical protein